MYNYYHHKREITAATSDMDFKGRIKPGAVMEYFQDIASNNAEASGYGYNDLLEKNLAWIILRMSIKIIKSPSIGETLMLATFPEKPGAANIDRGYYAYNEAGGLMLCGSSKWCVIDLDTHKIQRLAQLFETHDPALFIPYPPFDDGNPKLNELPAGGVTEGPFSYTVHVTDLDRNIHMNNARYGDVVLNVCGMEMLEKRSISRLDINFMSQLFAGDTFEVYKTQIDDVTYIEAGKVPRYVDNTVKTADTVFRARVEWD